MKSIAITTGQSFTAETTLDEWVAAGNEIVREADSSLWRLADWAGFGERTFDYETRRGERHKRADRSVLKEFCKTHGLEYTTLKVYAWVAERVTPVSRLTELSFGHHVEVAALAPAEQKKWLHRARAEGWSRAQLRKELRQTEARQGADGPKFDFGEKPILQLRAWIGELRVDELAADRKSALKEDLRPIVEFWEKL